MMMMMMWFDLNVCWMDECGDDDGVCVCECEIDGDDEWI